mgnify:CR=1 FL=1
MPAGDVVMELLGAIFRLVRLFPLFFRLRAEKVPDHDDAEDHKDHLKNIHGPDISIAAGTNATSAPVSAAKTSRAKSDEAEEIISALREHNGSRKETAAALHIDTSTLWRKMKKYGINS